MISNVRPEKSGFPKIAAMIGVMMSSTSDVDDAAERRAEHDRDREVDHVPAQQELLELLDHDCLLPWVGARAAILGPEGASDRGRLRPVA